MSRSIIIWLTIIRNALSIKLLLTNKSEPFIKLAHLIYCILLPANGTVRKAMLVLCSSCPLLHTLLMKVMSRIARQHSDHRIGIEWLEAYDALLVLLVESYWLKQSTYD